MATLPYLPVVYNSWHEYLAAVETRQGTRSGTIDMTQQIKNEHQSGWFGKGIKSMQDALALAKSGWKEGEVKANELSKALFAAVANQIEKENPVYDVEGNGLDIGAYLNGEPECWIRQETEVTAGAGHRLLKIAFNAMASAHVKTEVLEAKGACIVALVQLLEYAGHKVELQAVYGHEGHHYDDKCHHDLFIRVKDADQPIDTSKLSFCLVHPGSLRALEFSHMETLPVKYVQALGAFYNGGYSRPCDIQNPDDFDIYVPKSGGWEKAWDSPKIAMEFIVSNLKQQGVHIREGGK